MSEERVKRALFLVKTVRMLTITLAILSIAPGFFSAYHTYLCATLLQLGGVCGVQLALYAFTFDLRSEVSSKTGTSPTSI